MIKHGASANSPQKCLAKAKITSNATQLLLGCLQFGHIGEMLSGGKKIANVVMKSHSFHSTDLQ